MKKQKGFTLIELLVVIAIIGILSSVVLASLSTARAKSRDARRISDIGQVQLSLEMYFDSSSSYPVVGAIAAFGTNLNILTPNFLPKVPVDPTNVSPAVYKYSGSSTGYVLASQLERIDNVALISDADNVNAGISFNGTSIDCTGTAGTAQTGGGNGTERCYDVTN